MEYPCKILILNDSEDVTNEIISVLRNSGCNDLIDVCDNGEDFVKKLQKFKPTIVIAEHTIKGYSSFTALNDSRNAFSEMIFILVVDDIPEEFAIELLKEGIDDYVLKNHLIRLPHSLESARIKRQYKEKTKALELINKELKSANCSIEAKNKAMTQSIVFAERIQSLTLPKLDILLEDFKEAFVVYKPKDIVSGDFYWFYKRGEQVMVSAADCTGHGVSGALLSMIGTNFLNEIAENDNHFTHPSDVLSLLDLNITTLLKQDESSGYQDGIDIGFVTVDKKHKKLYFSGCKRPLLIYKRRDKKIVEYKGEPYYIGGNESGTKKTFASKEIPYQGGDVIYMFSDGVVDQFGGPSNKKLMKSRFIDMLMSFNHLSLTYQGQLLEQKLKKWQGEYDQTDDIIVIGIKL